MPRAVAVGLPEPAPQISASPRGYQSHFSHAGERIWPDQFATLIFGSKHSTLLGWIRCPHSPVPFPPTTMASNGHSLSNSRRISAGSMAWRSPRRSCGCRYWKRCLSTRRAGYPRTASFISWPRHRTACGCNDAVIKLRRWVKSHRWIPLVAQRLRRVHDHLAGRG